MVAVDDELATGATMATNDAGLKLHNNLAKSSSPYVRHWNPLISAKANSLQVEGS